MHSAEKCLLYWEDFKPGDRFELGSYFLSKEELITFGKQYDPLPMHVCEEEARKTPLGKLCASGIQTLAVAQRLQVDNLFSRVAVIAGVGLNNLKLPKPVTPDQNLALEVEILSCQTIFGKMDRGSVEYLLEVSDASGDLVASYEITVIVLRQEHG